MNKIICLLPLLLACTTISKTADTSKNYSSPPKQLYAGAFHKSYQYYVLTNNCTKTYDDTQPEVSEFCDMALELHYFVDSPMKYLMADVMQEHNHLFRFAVAPEFKVEVNENELSISSSVGGEWYKFEEKLENNKNLLWIRVSYEDQEKPMVADIVLDVTDPSQPKKVFVLDDSPESEEIQWNDIKKQLKGNKK